MKSENEVKLILRNWVLKNCKRAVPQELNNNTPLIDQRIVSSLQIIELILEIEKLRGKRLDLNGIKPNAFRSIDTIYTTFFSGPSHAA